MSLPGAAAIARELRSAGIDRERAVTSAIPRLWNCRQLASWLGVSVSWVRVWHKTGELQGHMLHAEPGDRGKLLFQEHAVLRFLKNHGIRGPQNGNGAG